MKKIIKDAKTFAQEKVPYVVPRCAVIPIEEERFFCTSLHPGKDGSTEDDWERMTKTLMEMQTWTSVCKYIK